MRRVIRAFQVEYKNSRNRSRRQGDSPLRLETVASVFGKSAPTGVDEAAEKVQLSEHVAKVCVIKKSIR